MRKWIFVLGLCGAVSAPFTQAASPVSATPLNAETATLGLALAGFYWEVYVPNYAPESPAFEHR